MFLLTNIERFHHLHFLSHNYNFWIWEYFLLMFNYCHLKVWTQNYQIFTLIYNCIFLGIGGIVLQLSMTMGRHMAMQPTNISKTTDQKFWMPHMIHLQEAESSQLTTPTDQNQWSAQEVAPGTDGSQLQNTHCQMLTLIENRSWSLLTL